MMIWLAAKRQFAASGAVWLATLLAPHGDATARMDRGHADLPCDSCHLIPANADSTPNTEFITDQEQLCGTCHIGAIEASHPSGFVVNRPLPREFPVNRAGMMTCSTCHDVHNAEPRHMRVAKTGRALCVSCHDGGFFDSMHDGGISLVKSGHVDASSIQLTDMDPYSVQCMACHTDMALPSGVGHASAHVSRHAAGSLTHSIGMDYERAVDFGGYRPAAQLANDILLPNGRTSCLSCHLGYSRDHGRLTRPRAGLCSECHAL